MNDDVCLCERSGMEEKVVRLSEGYTAKTCTYSAKEDL